MVPPFDVHQHVGPGAADAQAGPGRTSDHRDGFRRRGIQLDREAFGVFPPIDGAGDDLERASFGPTAGLARQGELEGALAGRRAIRHDTHGGPFRPAVGSRAQGLIVDPQPDLVECDR